MAKPALIYAFDNLGPDKFTEICNLLIANKYRGYNSGGVGPDGGIDGQVDLEFGYWIPENESTLINNLIPNNKKVVFQFKHKTSSRVGQIQSRKQIMNLFSSKTNNELDKSLLKDEDIYAYILVTNVEINSIFRETFIKTCINKNTNIEYFNVIGLDDLETWITMEPQIRHLYFPTIFGEPKYNLKVQLLISHAYDPSNFNNETKLFTINVLNIGTVPSYINKISITAIKDGKLHHYQIVQFPGKGTIESLNPKFGDPLEPGRKHSFNFTISTLEDIIKKGQIPIEIDVCDEIDNHYTVDIDSEFRENL